VFDCLEKNSSQLECLIRRVNPQGVGIERLVVRLLGSMKMEARSMLDRSIWRGRLVRWPFGQLPHLNLVDYIVGTVKQVSLKDSEDW